MMLQVPKLWSIFAFLLVFILAYNFGSSALMHHTCSNRASVTSTLSLFEPYWQMYGELQLDNIESASKEGISNTCMIILLSQAVVIQ